MDIFIPQLGKGETKGKILEDSKNRVEKSLSLINTRWEGFAQGGSKFQKERMQNEDIVKILAFDWLQETGNKICSPFFSPSQNTEGGEEQGQ